MDKYKIVKRLEYCVENKCDICQEENGSGFPWIDGQCYGFIERLYDALALIKGQNDQIIMLERGLMNLKAQEPRVLTLEEVKAKPDYAWIEKLDSKKTYIVLFDFTAILSDLSSYAHTWNHYGKDELLLLLLYNKTWRCWTSRPTDEQRKAIPWKT